MFFLALIVAVVAFPLCMNVVEAMVVRGGVKKNKSFYPHRPMWIFFFIILL